MPESIPGTPTLVARWVAAARPKTLPLTLTPVVAGIALALAETGRLSIWAALFTLIAAVAIQIGTNLHNDAADFERGTDTEDRVGPPRATAQGWLTARQVKLAAHLMFGLAFVLGLALLTRGGLPILAVGLASLAAGYAYTSGPRPIAYGPFGELYVLAFFGLAAVGGTYYLQTLSFGWTPLLVGLALGLPAAAVLLINNYRDLETDEAAGRATLCHYLGRPRARYLYSLLLIAPVAILMLTDLPGASWPPLAALPAAGLLSARLFRGALGMALNEQLARTAQYQALLVALMILGFIFHGPTVQPAP
ncbi:1,4-dihydroxy-2-naphthoate octaprenyltransferase [Thiorhodococcus minor]|uniref:1,4-dihydroxy-2-naphthoate octaprenyltransferase n=1 Tax=Thiorhodococcus minor TaxID=57489 RepID=A0A6M0K2N1_9GAMM|nr:1,4-dihydroxy-2-naphthoate octaprenyltransferase [Thiorhodococcus minor]NEV64028.1 1,4-dihydroxy-2-naphthoate octaprenyltransferase [Thiorhodococcus minor]